VSLFDSANDEVTGKIGFRHTYLQMSNLEVNMPNGEKVHTCPAAVGFSFAAGTTDGPGAFDFKQGDSKVSLTI
jgi:neutral ceramidase